MTKEQRERLLRMCEEIDAHIGEDTPENNKLWSFRELRKMVAVNRTLLAVNERLSGELEKVSDEFNNPPLSIRKALVFAREEMGKLCDEK